MNITSISTKSSAHFSPLNNNNDIKLLEKQKMQLQEQIQKVKESKIDNKTKQEKVKQLQDQIQQIDIEIQQKQSEKLNKKQNIDKQTARKQPSKVDNQYSNNFTGITHLIEADITYSKVKIMNKVKNNLEAKGKILKIEIEADESRSLSGSKASAKRQELQEIEFSKQSLGKKVGEMNKAVQKQVEETKDEEIKDNNTNNDDKDKKLENN